MRAFAVRAMSAMLAAVSAIALPAAAQAPNAGSPPSASATGTYPARAKPSSAQPAMGRT